MALAHLHQTKHRILPPGTGSHVLEGGIKYKNVIEFAGTIHQLFRSRKHYLLIIVLCYFSGGFESCYM